MKIGGFKKAFSKLKGLASGAFKKTLMSPFSTIKSGMSMLKSLGPSLFKKATELFKGGPSSFFSKLFSKSGLSNLISGFANKFISGAGSLLSGSGITSLFGLGKNLTSSNGLLSMLQSVLKSTQQTPATTDGAQEGAQANMQQLLAYLQASQIRNQLQSAGIMPRTQIS